MSTQSKALIKYSDMDDAAQQMAVDCCAAAFERFSLDQDVAKYVKNEFDRRFGGVWHCVVGTNFGSYVAHTPKCFLYFLLNSRAILLFKAKV
ncbi:hypothetical protein EG68_03219 [Paragonimus skrjabini miyazakii]|uniref:Dynein light chain n=1 Tax=Paragonimus skrjabini miyazakii TaxID=59628 RepID=A0A8S9Z6P3_9TREM|nr:hypothetical protein EG68_03219 [Paragonimus skrjabini miyazakii]